MKYFIASDIHGSAYYCKKMLDAYKEEQADRLILLGDLLYHGPRNPLPEAYNPKEVAAMLNPLADRIFCVRGNCDSEVDQMVLDFPILAEYCLIAENGHTVFITHGHHYNLDSASSKRRRPTPRTHTCSGLYFYRDVHLSESGFCLSSKRRQSS